MFSMKQHLKRCDARMDKINCSLDYRMGGGALAKSRKVACKKIVGWVSFQTHIFYIF